MEIFLRNSSLCQLHHSTKVLIANQVLSSMMESTASEVQPQKVGLGNCPVGEIRLESKKFEDVKKSAVLNKSCVR